MSPSLDRAWRIVGTGLSFAVFGLGGVTIGLISLLFFLPLPVSAARKQRWTRSCISAATAWYIRFMRAIGLLSYRIETAPHLYDPGQLIIANHPSLLDVVFLLSMLPDTTCIVKGALWRNPFTAVPARLAGYIRNDSETMLEDAAAAIRSGERLIVFPEGTRNRYDDELNLKRGAANIAVMADCQITPVLIRVTPRTLQKHEPWYRVPPTPPLFEFTVCEPMQVAAHIDRDRPRSIQVRQLTRAIRRYYLQHLGQPAAR